MATRIPWARLKALIERFDEHNFTGGDLQRLLANWDVISQIGKGTLDRITLLKALELAKSQLYAKEEVPVDGGYPADWKMEDPRTQVRILWEHFPQLGPLPSPEDRTVVRVPTNFDEYLAWPEPSALVPDSKHPYHDALGLVLGKLAEVHHGFTNSLRGQLGPDCLRLRRKTVQGQKRAHQRAGGGDWCIAIFQSGRRHGGRSIRRARMVFRENEWGAGPYEVAVFLLTHPDRLTSWRHLGIACPGAKYDHLSSGRFTSALCFDSHQLSDVPIILALGGSGSASFLG